MFYVARHGPYGPTLPRERRSETAPYSAMISYAQNFEDVILNRVLREIDAGFYIDIGAQDPVADSVSLAFYEKGWRGIHVEPNPIFAQRIRGARPDEEVLEVAIGLTAGPITFFVVGDTGLSTGIEKNAQDAERAGHKIRKIDVSAVPLAAVFDRCCGRDIHWLKIDAEGMEQQIIESWTPSSARPWVVLVESIKPVYDTSAPGELHSDHENWEPFLSSLGYTFVYFDGLNRFYLSDKKAELRDRFRFGPSIFDDFQFPTWSRHLGAVRTELEGSLASTSVRSKSMANARRMDEGLQQIVDRQSVALEQVAMELQALRKGLGDSESALSDSVSALAAEKRAAQDAEMVQQRAADLASDALAAERERSRSESKARRLLSEELLQRDRHIEASENASLKQITTIERLRKEKRTLQRAADQARRERNALRTSASWRLTAPLRATRRAARALLKSLLRAALAVVKSVPGVRSVARILVRAVPPLHRAVRSASRTTSKRKGAANQRSAKGLRSNHSESEKVKVPFVAREAPRRIPALSRRSRGLYWITRAAQSRAGE